MWVGWAACFLVRASAQQLLVLAVVLVVLVMQVCLRVYHSCRLAAAEVL